MKGLYFKDSRRLVPHRRLYLRVLGNRSNSNSNSKTPLRASSSTRQLVQRVQRQEQGNQPDNTELTSVRKLKRSTESPVEQEEPEFKVDLRIKELHKL